MAMHNLNALAPNEAGRREHETQFGQPFRRRRAKRDAGLADALRKEPSFRPGDPNRLPELMQTPRQLGALIVRATAGQQRVQMQDPQGRAHGTAAASK